MTSSDCPCSVIAYQDSYAFAEAGAFTRKIDGSTRNRWKKCNNHNMASFSENKTVIHWDVMKHSVQQAESRPPSEGTIPLPLDSVPLGEPGSKVHLSLDLVRHLLRLTISRADMEVECATLISRTEFRTQSTTKHALCFTQSDVFQ
jgi:hypothetical protein